MHELSDDKLFEPRILMLEQLLPLVSSNIVFEILNILLLNGPVISIS